MKWLSYITVLLLLISCQQENPLTTEEVVQIKVEINKSVEKHFQDLKNLDYREMMTFYADVDDFVIFGDGNYWGDYITIDMIWEMFTEDIKIIYKSYLKNNHIYLFSRNSAVYLAETGHERIDVRGDTTKFSGSFSFGMENFNGEWKAVTMNVTHHYEEGYGDGGDRDWWKEYSPEGREKKKE